MDKVVPKHTYGVKSSTFDNRDFKFAAISQPVEKLPVSADMRPMMPPVYNQGHIGSCFTGNTLIPLLNGTVKTLKELTENNESFWVYSNDGNGKIVPGKAKAYKTGIDRELVKVILDNGEQIVCTPDHQFMLRDGSYLEVGKITPDDSLMPLKRVYDERGYESVFCGDIGKYRHTHLLVKSHVEERPKTSLDITNEEHTKGLKGYTEQFVEWMNNESPESRKSRIVIHHIDFNQRNNSPENLKYMGQNEHLKYHSILGSFGFGFEHWNGTEKQREHSRKLALRMHQENPGWNLEGASMGGKTTWEAAQNDPMRLTNIKDCLAIGRTDPVVREKANESIRSYHANKTEDQRKQTSERGKQNWKTIQNDPSKVQQYSEAGKFLAASSYKYQSLKYGRRLLDRGLDINEDNWSVLRKEETRANTPKFSTISKYFPSMEQFKLECENYNHKIVSIETLDYVEDVYCLQVEQYHNFALEAGAFVHNCTSMGIAAAYEYDLKKQGLTDFLPSRLFIYYNERVLENDVAQDAGAQIRDGIKSIATTGICEDTLWPYDEGKFAVKPTQEAYDDALKHTAVQYYNVNVIEQELKQALAQGFPVVAGIMIFESFESEYVAATGHVPMPNSHEQLFGGHCILIVGYNDANNYLTVRNSWGTEWGDKGYFYLPYGFITPSLMTDLWVVQAIVST